MGVCETLPAAARVSGASWWQAQRDTVFPLIRPALLGGWLFVFVPCLAELTVSALLYSAGNETVGVAVFNLLESGIVSPAAALALVLMLIALGGSAARAGADPAAHLTPQPPSLKGRGSRIILEPWVIESTPF